MTKRYRETLEAVECDADGMASEATGRWRGAPTRFRWRGESYQVLNVLGHWREDPGWWNRGGAGTDGGEQVRIEQTDLWRVEAQNGRPSRGVYELIRRGDEWRLDRVWD